MGITHSGVNFSIGRVDKTDSDGVFNILIHSVEQSTVIDRPDHNLTVLFSDHKTIGFEAVCLVWKALFRILLVNNNAGRLKSISRQRQIVFQLFSRKGNNFLALPAYT